LGGVGYPPAIEDDEDERSEHIFFEVFVIC
jgi:hypothetical protein